MICTELKRKLVEVNKFSNLGSCGEVYTCSNRETGILRAVKIIRKMEYDEAEQARLLREINILKILDHPNIVRLYEIYYDYKRYYLVTE